MGRLPTKVMSSPSQRRPSSDTATLPGSEARGQTLRALCPQVRRPADEDLMPVLAAGIGISSVPGTGLGSWGPEGRRHSLPWPTVSGAGKGLRLYSDPPPPPLPFSSWGDWGSEGRMLSPQSPRGVRSRTPDAQARVTSTVRRCLPDLDL